MSNYGDDQQQDRGFSLASLGKLAGAAAGFQSSAGGGLANAAHNPAFNAAVDLQRRHPGEMVFLEVAAAGALLYNHKQRKARQEQIRLEAEEDLKRRGWDGGAKLHQQDSFSRQNSGLQVPNGQQRPLSAPPSQAWQSSGPMGRRGDDDLAYGSYTPPAGPPPSKNNMAYGKSYNAPPADQPYLPPQGPPQSWQSPPPQYQNFPPQQYGPPPPQNGWQGSPPPLRNTQTWGPGYPPQNQGYLPPQGGWGAPQGPPQPYGYYPQAPGPY